MLFPIEKSGKFYTKKWQETAKLLLDELIPNYKEQWDTEDNKSRKKGLKQAINDLKKK